MSRSAWKEGLLLGGGRGGRLRAHEATRYHSGRGSSLIWRVSAHSGWCTEGGVRKKGAGGGVTGGVDQCQPSWQPARSHGVQRTRCRHIRKRLNTQPGMLFIKVTFKWRKRASPFPSPAVRRGSSSCLAHLHILNARSTPSLSRWSGALRQVCPRTLRWHHTL